MWKPTHFERLPVTDAHAKKMWDFLFVYLKKRAIFPASMGLECCFTSKVRADHEELRMFIVVAGRVDHAVDQIRSKSSDKMKIS